MRKKLLPLSKVYGLLETGPVVLLTTSHKGRANVMTQSWHTLLEFDPPLIGVVVSNRNASFEALRKSGQCVINIPTEKQGAAVAGCGNVSARRVVDKFKKFGLTPSLAAEVDAPLIDECYASIECKVVDRKLVNAYNFFILQAVRAWIDPAVKKAKTLHHMGYGQFMVAGDIVKLRSKAR